MTARKHEEEQNRTSARLDVVALFAANDVELRKTVTAALERRGIPCYVEGSIQYEVLVERRHWKAARETLVDLRLKPTKLELVESEEP